MKSTQQISGTRLAKRFYRILLLIYPAEFRRTYGREATEVFGELFRDARSEGGGALLGLLKRSLEQVLASGIRERLEAMREWGRAAMHRRPSPRRSRHGRKKNLEEQMDSLLQDLRFAFRSLRKKPGFTITTVLIVALGVGATTTIFSVVDGVLLRPLPYPEPAELMILEKEGSVSIPDYVDFRDRTTSFEAWGATWDVAIDLTGDGTPERLEAAQITPVLLSMLGARTQVGRLLTPDDFEAGASAVAVLSHRFWQRRWGGDRDVVGRTIILNGDPVVVVGALNPDFRPPEALELADIHIYVPLELNRVEFQSRRFSVLDVLARLEDDVSFAEARAELDVLGAALAEEYPEDYIDPDGTPVPIDMTPLQEATVGNIGPTLYMFLGAVALLLLIACANVANLFLARGMDREGEMAIRSALGANHGRLMAQLLTESVLLAIIGGTIGIATAFLGVEAFRVLNPGGIPRLGEVAVDLRVLGFALALSTLTGIIFGIVPAITSAWTDAYTGLREGTSRHTAGRSRLKLRNGLVVAEIGLALMLLAGAGLLFNSFLRLRQVDTGFEPEGMVTLQLNIQSAYEGAERLAFAEALLERLTAAPGATAVGASWTLPFAGGRCCFQTSLQPAGAGARARYNDDDDDEDDQRLTAYIHPVTSGYFKALGFPILQGRGLTRQDDALPAVAPPNLDELGNVQLTRYTLPAIANRQLAERFWPDGDVLGKTLALNFLPGVELEIVGVSDEILHWNLNADRGLDIYVPFAAFAGWIGLLDVAVRHEGPVGPVAQAMRQAVWELDPNLPLGEIVSMEKRISRSITAPRFYTLLLATFATIAFLLAAGGIYGSMLYSVGQRQREMGIRIALGARSANVVRMIVGRGMILIGIGIGLGLAGAITLSSVLESLVFGIATTDPATLIAVSVLLAVVATAACYFPARVAARADPLETLRAE